MRKGCWWSILGVGTLAVYAGVRVFTIFWDFGEAADELPQAIRDYRTQGLPWTAADLERDVSDGENAAHELRLAIAEMPREKRDDVFGFSSSAGEPKATDVAPYARSLTRLHQAVSYPRLDFHRDWDQGPLLLFPEFAHIKRLTKVLAARAQLRAAEGDDAGALQDLGDAYRLARLTSQEPVLIAALCAFACEATMLSGAERCLAQAADSPDRLKKYRDWLSRLGPLPDVRRSFRFEIYSSLVFARNIDRLGGLRSSNPLRDFEFLGGEEEVAAPPEGMRRDGIPPAVRARAYMARHLQSWAELYRRTDGLRADYPTVERVWLEIGDRIDQSRGLSHQLDAVLFPTFLQSMKSPLRLLANRRKALALADALLARKATGTWPTAVSEIDPYSGRPLRVRFDGKRFRVWSLGPNGVDNGGISSFEAAATMHSSDDLVAMYPPILRPARKPPSIPYFPGNPD